ncbi:MAG: ATP-dependent DNA helicase RecG [Oscillospiraceae bacterium]|jgi:ATP-dependent DNA helicase RecG|nr:ATP-dependent DNA helicase RecG [Oscillospiraceae bacterium]
MLDIFDNVVKLKSVGEINCDLYNKLGIYTINDILWHIPRSYIDFGAYVKIEETQHEGLFAVRGYAVEKKSIKKKNLTIYTVTVTDGNNFMDVQIFNGRQVYQAIASGVEFVFWGRIIKTRRIVNMQLRSFVRFKEGLTMQPSYSLTAGLKSRMVAASVQESLRRLSSFHSLVPAETQKQMKLVSLPYAFQNIHFPKTKEALVLARNRLMFDELVNFSLGVLEFKAKKSVPSEIKIKDFDCSEFYKTIKFEPTNAQKRVINEIVLKIKSGATIWQLIQGDVGCGKTLVVTAIAYLICKNGYQAAIMAPTAVLANQHYENFKEIFKFLKVKVERLAGKLTATEKQRVKELLVSGEISCVVGTSALTSPAIKFKNLGLVVTDEQHKFGVRQREKLSEKGSNPHTIIMSATPIPRTLAMMLYNNIDMSIIDEAPPGRKPIKTYFVTPNYRVRIYNFMKKEIEDGRQCYIVCPFVELEEDENVTENEEIFKSVKEYAETLKTGIFSDYTVEFIHGKMVQSKKETLMQAFKRNEIQILVATTIIEVGVDVSNASIILIEGAENFGLAQLHQLRGRIGRSNLQSYCILLSGSENEGTKKRLAFVAKHTNGFEIAEFDLKTRGPGELLGVRQHGAFNFKIADPYNMELLLKAQATAKFLLQNNT